MANEKIPCNVNYFVYKGTIYGIGTKVLLSESFYYKFYGDMYKNVKRYNKPHIFKGGLSNGYNLFYCDDIGNIQLSNYDEDILEIIEPVYANITPWQKQAINNMTSGKVHADVFGGVLLYIVAMLVGVIFKDRWLIWIFGTIIFVIWLLKQYRT